MLAKPRSTATGSSRGTHHSDDFCSIFCVVLCIITLVEKTTSSTGFSRSLQTHHQTMTGSHRSLEPQLQTTARPIQQVLLARHTHIRLHGFLFLRGFFFFETVFTITTVPGHTYFSKNMITGASQASVDLIPADGNLTIAITKGNHQAG